ncbi:MAG: response regulator [Dehalococcoidales bacterium]|nr:response regulator [Dehalococcoidales bacterium]
MSSGQRKVLVVDDDPFIRSLLAAWLQEVGYDVLTAGDGLQALAQLQSERPDVLLLDLMMPKLDGYAVAEWVRRQEAGRHKGFDGTNGHLPIIVLSADARAPQKLSGLPIDAFVSKPFDLDDVLETVVKHAPLEGLMVVG